MPPSQHPRGGAGTIKDIMVGEALMLPPVEGLLGEIWLVDSLQLLYLQDPAQIHVEAEDQAKQVLEPLLLLDPGPPWAVWALRLPTSMAKVSPGSSIQPPLLPPLLSHVSALYLS